MTKEREILEALLEYNEYLFTFIDRDNVTIGTEKEDVINWYNEKFLKKEKETILDPDWELIQSAPYGMHYRHKKTGQEKWEN